MIKLLKFRETLFEDCQLTLSISLNNVILTFRSLNIQRMSLELNIDDIILLRILKETLKRISNYGHICFNSAFVTYDPAVEALNLLLQKECYRGWYPNWQLNGNNSLKQELGDSFQ